MAKRCPRWRSYALWHACFALTCLVHPAHAQETPSLELRWTAPSSCPTPAAVEEQVSRLAPSPAPREQPLSVQASVRQSDDERFELDLILRDGRFVGRRRFRGDSCAEVVGAAAVAIALVLSSGQPEALGSSGAQGASPKEAGPEVEGDSAAGSTSGDSQADPNAPGSRNSDGTTTNPPGRSDAEKPANDARDGASDRAPTAPERDWQIVLSAPTLSVGFVFLPESSVGLGAGFGLETGAWRFVLSATYYFDLDVSLADSTDRGASVARRSARAAACRWLGSGSMEFAPCLNVALQYLAARGEGSDVIAEKAAAAWIALGPGMLSRLRVSESVGLVSGVGLEMQTARPRLTIDGLGEVEQVGTLELTGSIAVEWIF